MIAFLKKQRYVASVVILVISALALLSLFAFVQIPDGYNGLKGFIKWAYTLGVMLPCYGVWCGIFLLIGGVKGFVHGAYYGFWIAMPLTVVTFFIIVVGIAIPSFVSTAISVVPMLLLQSWKEGYIARHTAFASNVQPPKQADVAGKNDRRSTQAAKDKIVHRIVLFSYKNGLQQILFDYSLYPPPARQIRKEFKRYLDISFDMAGENAPDQKTIKALNLAMKRCEGWSNDVAFAGSVLDYSEKTVHIYLYYHPRTGYLLHRRMQKLIRRYGIIPRFESVIDESWSLYTGRLLPDEYTLHRLQNERISDGLQRRGVDISALHNICFNLRFAADASIASAKEQLVRNGYEIRSEATDDEGILLTVERKARLGIDTLNALTDWLIATLRPLSGQLSHYDIEPLA